MAKFFNKTYKHAYARGKSVWIKGKIDNNPYARISTKKKFNKTNMNWAEKHWEDELRRYFHKKRLISREDDMPTLNEYAVKSFEQHKSSRDFATTNRYKEKYKHNSKW